jgi:hypothetical protein
MRIPDQLPQQSLVQESTSILPIQNIRTSYVYVLLVVTQEVESTLQDSTELYHPQFIQAE